MKQGGKVNERVFTTATGEGSRGIVAVVPPLIEEVQRIDKPRVRKQPFSALHSVKKNSPINSIKPDMRVWRKAMELAGGDKNRLFVRRSRPNEVIVLNNPKPKGMPLTSRPHYGKMK
jgi:hypothetical protein